MRSVNEIYPLEKVAEAYARMESGIAHQAVDDRIVGAGDRIARHAGG